jgi:hypothetical protein
MSMLRDGTTHQYIPAEHIDTRLVDAAVEEIFRRAAIAAATGGQLSPCQKIAAILLRGFIERAETKVIPAIGAGKS